ncbi:3083_t:CDS:1 [Paraglomus occultum]|uniref:3083_t:CDS:1 n=1 Tax=Paraglomus occultum TaxID=144539 RepID=A0A9N9B195_9GLOM|nr:3083_t:CDS:1 [Paraglomus occultum]
MKSVYFLFLSVALILANLTPFDASPLEKRWNKPCCPVSRCVFTQGDIPAVAPPGFAGNTFNGYLQFVQSPRPTLQIDGIINIFGTVNGPIEGVYDVHVADCSTANTTTPGDPAILDLDFASFNQPIFSASTVSIADIQNQCCFVVDEFSTNERILGIAPVIPVVDCANITSSPVPTVTAGPSNPSSSP